MSESDNIRAQVENHVTKILHPAYPSTIVQPALEAIEAVNQGKPCKLINLASGAGGHPAWLMMACTIVEDLHLESYLEQEEP